MNFSIIRSDLNQYDNNNHVIIYTNSQARDFPILKFDEKIILTLAEVLKLKIDSQTGVSNLEFYKDSTFDFYRGSDGYHVTRRRNAEEETIGHTPIENDHLAKIQETRLHINTIQLLPKRELKISELSINNENLYKISTVAREWQRISSQNRLKCESASYQKFEDSRRISMLMAECMEQPNETAQIWNRIFICKDAAQDEIQAIALVFAQQAKLQLKIAHLVTHPRNIRSNINKNEWTRVEGAGRAIIDYLAAIISNDQEIYVESVESAKLFYIKQGFEELDSQEQRPFEFGTAPMRLTKQKFTVLSEKNNQTGDSLFENSNCV